MPEEPASDARSNPEAGLERTLREAEVLAMERVAVGSNAVFEVLLEGAGGQLRAIYKPARGERPLWDFPAGTLHRREVATAVVDRALGWTFTPTTVIRPQAPFGIGSMQAFVLEPPPDLALDRERLEHRLRGLAALDVVINNADRKRGHLLVDPAGNLKGIDHGVTFNTEFKLRTVLAELGGSSVPEEWLDGLRSLLTDQTRMTSLRRKLRPLLARAEIAAFEGRARELVAVGRFPILHPWYGRPFEM
ncbi:MAG: protein kinase family protein [Candidatus Dormibacteria bacterium]